jgi:MFS family permease
MSAGPFALSGRRNVLLLAIGQALMLSAVVLAMTLAAILGGVLAPDKGLATLPVAAMVIGTAITSMPASWFMRRHGRRIGFLFGIGLGLAGSLVSVWGLHSHTFTLFVLGHLLIGGYQGFASYYRFAAVEAAGARDASRAIAWVVAAGVVAAFVGPQLAVWGRDWLASKAFVGSYLAQALLSLLALATIAQLRLPPIASGPVGEARPLRVIVAQPALRASVFGAAVGYAVMIMAMTATPLAMLGCGLDTRDVGPVIQWHVVGMFAPSFFTGALVARYGAPRIMQAGFVLLLGHVAIAVSGQQWLHFLSALILLGVGWNFAFIGGTALLTQAYRASEQTKVQAFNESIVFGIVALSSLGAGWLYDRFGWSALNVATVPLLIAALAATIRIERRLGVTAAAPVKV